jgi:hypothetical protein
MRDRRLLTIALASVFTLASTIALAGSVRHKPNVRAHDLHAPQVGSRVLHPSYGNSDGTVSAGGYLWNGRSASEAGGG